VSNSKIAEWAWKVATALVYPIMFALFAWVWNTHARMVEYEMQIANLEQRAVKHETFHESFIEMRGDVRHIVDALNKIETKVDRELRDR